MEEEWERPSFDQGTQAEQALPGLQASCWPYAGLFHHPASADSLPGSTKFRSSDRQPEPNKLQQGTSLVGEG